jgi:hypothetical protein
VLWAGMALGGLLAIYAIHESDARRAVAVQPAG